MIKVTILPYMNPSAYSSGDMASDYELDMVRHGLTELENVSVQQIPENPLMFKNCDKNERKKVWGKGFTLYGLLESPPTFPIEDSNLIIVVLHHTQTYDKHGFHRFIKDVISKYKKKTIAIDGTDFHAYEWITAELCLYFKRELLDGPQKALPIFFAIPEEKFCKTDCKKIYDFSPMVPTMFCWNHGHANTYIYQTEEEYYQQYQQSYFAYSSCKAGWATGRGQEIIANKCIPYWTDIERCPTNSLWNYPKDLCIAAKRLKGVLPGTVTTYNPDIDTYIGDTRQIKLGEERGKIDWNKFDIEEYNELLNNFIVYGLRNLTTKALARYILEKSL